MSSSTNTPPHSDKQDNDNESKLCRSYNFGPASSRDSFLYTSSRPGFSNDQDVESNYSDEAVMEWIDFMKTKQGISRVVVVLEEDELRVHEPSSLAQLYEKGGLQCTFQPLSAPGASNKIFQVLDEAAQKNEKVVAHCEGGVNRAGRVAAGWLVHEYKLTPEEATKEVLQKAEENGVQRGGDADKLQKWMNNN